MKNLIALIISGALVVSGYSQTRNVLVGTNNAVVQPTNFWSADASNARTGLGLGTASTNPASAFQPSSAVLSNLSTGNGANLTNISATIVGTNVSITNVGGLQAALDGKLATNGDGSGITNIAGANIVGAVATASNISGTIAISNVANLQTSLDGKLGTNPTLLIANISNLQTTLDGKLGTNPTLAISNISLLQTTLDGKLASNGNAINLTNFPTSLLRVDGSAEFLTNFPALLLRTNGSAAGLTNFPTLNQNTTGTASNVTGVVAIANGGTGATNAANARTALGLGTAATNSATAFQPSSSVLSNLANNDGSSLTNITASNIGTVALASNITGTAPLATNVTGVVALANGGTGATNATGARVALGVGASDVFVGLTNLGVGANLGFASSPYILGSTNSTAPNNAVLALDGAGVRSVAGLTLAALTNTDNAAFRTAIGLGSASTNESTAFQSASTVLSNLASSNGAGLTNITAANITGTVALASNVTGTIAISNGGSGATTAGGARTNFGLVLTALTNTNADTFRAGIGLGGADQVEFLDVTAEELKAGTNVVVSLINQELTDNGVAVLSWSTNGIDFIGSGVKAATRTNLGLGASWLTNTNNPVFVNTNGEVVSPTNFWQEAPITTTFIESQPTTNSSTNISPSRLLHIHSLATNIVNVTNTIVLPTNTLTFEGDMAMVVHKGPTNSLTQVRQSGSTNNLITLNKFNEAVEFTYYNNAWQFLETAAFTAPIYFSGTNVVSNAAESRTNLGLGATWLTNTDVTNFRTAIGLGTTNSVSFFTIDADAYEARGGLIGSNGIGFEDGGQNITRTNLGLPLAALTNTSVTNFQKAIFYTNTAPSNIGGNLGTIAAWIEIVASNGVTYKIPAYTNVP